MACHVTIGLYGASLYHKEKRGEFMESFEEVYQKYLKEVYCFLLRLSGDREIAEELT